MRRTRSRRTTRRTRSSSITIKGFSSCPYFQKAVKLAKSKKKQGKVKRLIVKRYSRKTFFSRVGKMCPLVTINNKKIAGYDGLQRYFK